MINILKVEKIVKLFSKDGDWMHVILLVCCVAHWGYLFLFYYLGIKELFIFNIFSIIAYKIIVHLSKIGKYKIAYVLTYLEIFLHQLYGMYIVGPDSGFDLILCCLFLFQFGFFSKRTCFYLSIFLITVLYGYYSLSDCYDFMFSSNYLDYKRYSDIFYYINEGVLISFMIVYAILASLVSNSKIDDLKYIVHHDMLTGLYNRKYLEDTVLPNIDKKSMLFCICDIDDFKKINDKKGHDVGDIVLKRLGLVFAKASSEIDIDIIRWGGEEFLICGDFKTENECKLFLDNLRLSINSSYIRQIDGNVTMTFGAVFVANPRKNEFKKYFKMADKALYKGKANGKNMVVFMEA